MWLQLLISLHIINKIVCWITVCFSIRRRLQQLEDIKSRLSSVLLEIFQSASVSEWLATHLQPIKDKIFRIEQVSGSQLAIGMGETEDALKQQGLGSARGSEASMDTIDNDA